MLKLRQWNKIVRFGVYLAGDRNKRVIEINALKGETVLLGSSLC